MDIAYSVLSDCIKKFLEDFWVYNAGVNQDSFPEMIIGFAESIIVWSSAFLLFIDW